MAGTMTNAQAMMVLLDKTGWSQRRLATVLEVTPGTVTRWRNQSRRDSGEKVSGETASVPQHTLWLAEIIISSQKRYPFVPRTTKGLEAAVRLAMRQLRERIDRSEEKILQLIQKEEI
jgi:transcriptional regulator with XRE-family HTH domain